MIFSIIARPFCFGLDRTKVRVPRSCAQKCISSTATARCNSNHPVPGAKHKHCIQCLFLCIVRLMKKNQKGFSLVEVLLVLIFITLIGFIGWYVMDRNKTTNKANNNVTSAVKPAPDNSKYKTFSHKELSFTFQLPKDWTTLDTTTSYGYYSAKLRAPGTEVESNQGEIIKSGAQILLIRQVVSPATTDNIDKFVTSGAHGSLTDKNTVSVDGAQALEYTEVPILEGGNDGSYKIHGVRFYKNEVSYGLELDNSKYVQAEYGNVFDGIIKSIKFN
jgi:type II secretory pathway pseudopilin PulG